MIISKELAVETYKQLLAQHDVYYARSDDSKAYRKGANEYQALVAMQKTLDVDKVIWNRYFN